MSKIFNSDLMSAYIDMAKDPANLSHEDEQIFLSIHKKKDRIQNRFIELFENFNSLDMDQLIELKELKDALDEMLEMEAQRTDSEEVQRIINYLSSKEETLPVLGKMRLDAFRKVQETKKVR